MSDEFNSCGNCLYYEYDTVEKPHHWCCKDSKECPDAFMCEHWEEEINDAHTDDDYDRCYECTGYGDDYYVNDEGELVSACDDCPFNGRDEWDDY